MKAPLVKSFESALPLQTMELVTGETGSYEVDQFLSRFSVHRARPLYPGVARLKKQGFSDLQIATTVRNRFSHRASRLQAGFRPPEVSRTYVFELEPGMAQDTSIVLATLQADPNVEFAEQEKVVTTNFTPNDPYFSSYGSWGQAYLDLWGINLIGAASAWDTSTGAGVIVAVVDTGIDFTHPDLVSNIWTNTRETPGNGLDDDGNGYIDDVHGWDFIGPTYSHPVQSNNPVDHFGHGTHVSGTIAATGNNGIGVIGVAWNSQIMPVKGLDDTGTGIDSTLGPAIIYAANNGADVISNSWAGMGSSQTIADAVSYAYNLGVVVVAAAGNNNDDARNYYPANLPQVITVAATDHNDNIAYFSNWGSKIDVAAPGVDILSLRAAGTTMGTPVNSYYTRADGTSMAAPHVSGLASLILAQHPTYSNEDVRQAVRASANNLGTSGFDLNYGYGRINASAALALPGVLEAKILSPSDGTHVSAATTIAGVARGSAFSQYKLEYGSGQTPTTWILIQTGSSPVGRGTLAVFDPSTVPDGIYVIRLTAYDITGRSFVDRIELSVNYLSITSPPPPAVPVVAAEYKPGAQISIVGTATGASFQDFRLDWAEGINPTTGWNNTGISMNGGGTSPVTNGTLGIWDTTAITNADYYTIRLSVDNNGFTSTAFTLIYLEPSLISQSWPIALDEGAYWSSGMVPATDAVGNQKLTMVGLGTTTRSEYKTFSPDGSTQTSSPLTWYGSLFQPATGDLDGNPGDEAVMTDYFMLRVFHADNTSYTLTPAQNVNFTYSQVVMEDLNNDSQDEILALGEDRTVPNAYVYAYLRNGQQLNSNFPITIANQNSNIDTYTKGNRLFAGDIDGDGNREILALEGTTSSTFTPRLFAHDGTPKTWSALSYNGYPDQLVLADLDHNGTLETIFTCSCNSEKELHVLQPNGTERAGWPVVLQSYAGNMSYIAVGDINKDGREEIVVSIGTEIFVLEDNGISFSGKWPIVGTGYTSFGPVVLADINGDGLPEIVTSEYAVNTASNPLLPGGSAQSADGKAVRPTISTKLQIDANGNKIMRPRVDVSTQMNTLNQYNAPQIVALRNDASVTRFWNMLGANGNQPFYMAKLTVGDFNKDGITDIAATYWTTEGGGMGGWLKEGVATVLSTGTPVNTSANDWPMIYQNPRNTAVLIRDHTSPNVSISSPTTGASVSGHVTVSANAWDNVQVTGVQFQLDGANLGSTEATAPFSVVWDTTQSSQSSHTLMAIATDAAGNQAVSTPVTVTVTQASTLTISPSTLAFGGQALNTTSAPQTVTVSNTGAISVTISSISASGDFAQTNNCGTSLASGAVCTVSVTYTPTVRGPEGGSLTVSGNFTSSPTVVALSGTGQAVSISLAPSSLNFGNQVVNTTSAPQNVTITNTGDIAVNLSGYTGGAPYNVTDNCPYTLNPGANCNFSITFAPTSFGTYQENFNISGTFSGSPAQYSVTGTGLDTVAVLVPSSLSFGNQLLNTMSSAQTLTVVNQGNTIVTISSIQASGDFTQTNNCGGSIAVYSSCSISVTFTPTATGARSGSITVNSNTRIAIPPSTLSGTGTAPTASFNVSSLTFPSQRVNTSSTIQIANLTNTGTAPLAISAFTIAGDFAQTNNCGTSLYMGSTCQINVTFKPTATGSRTGTLTLNSNNPGPPPTVALTGTGIASMASLSPSSLTFAAQNLNTTSSSQFIIVTNSGTASLNVSSITTSGDFSQTNNCGVVAAGGTCTVNISFTPAATGTRTGTLTVADDALNGSPQTASLSGTGVSPIAALSPTSLTFANQLVNTTSPTQPVRITNSGTGNLSISSISISGDFSQTNNCGTSLSAGASCTVNVAFTPTATGTRTGTLAITDNAANGSPQAASLSGTGIAPLAALSPTSLTFANQFVNTASGTRPVQLTNSGVAVLNISSVSISGDFSQTNNCGTSLGAGASCTVNVTFTPTLTGSRTGTLTITDNALNGSPQTASLTGTGLDFSVAASPTSVTVSAGNTASYTTTVTALGGNLGASVSLTCLSGLPAASSCAFSPASTSPGSGSANSSFTISTTARHGKNGTPAGTYIITLQGASASGAHTATVTLKVN
ncbi:MAG TPA: choice-of-anchor D domain-containing protein [Candidatus Sulfotelmatobacter sp.]|nr:choice-of-anchor D domain-containing protein [Candidatus Sulfotelmatobacter sp.]